MENKSKQLAIVLAVTAIIVSVLVAVKFSAKQQQMGSLAPTPAGTQNKAQDKATMMLEEGQAVSLKLQAKGLKINAMAVRLVLNYTGSLDFKFKDEDSKKEGVQVKTSANLLGKGWVYPINKITIDDKNKTAVLELAVVNLDPAGYVGQNEDLLATIEYTSAKGEVPSFKFDPAQTKLIAKSGEEISLDLLE
ncbi:hypothetical protein A2627_03960 [Candidatus Woesebacteria bacterium RIFCSPHIGHO2_01_FULL_39_28]|uniref:Cohesin domain-containing protein n=1 Tax=Candidatus Woesebacteria bacterium RIFCSPHIGHO2_01_FULL_39_28 TaxID=1802496 RepID=A0A1F7YFR8_9BACT|nr:MAG: hypothetical protein A2627_03960 [Candidatus Woesebacteria bacterium RIFCSPHIGHO2_01_FULL_39_28]OGM57245.1 MAG: hypothetical protein A3A50_00520 [Candidatus Woesebacteria bacterium RIFCSPLOWO2_01_FULL_38_20]